MPALPDRADRMMLNAKQAGKGRYVVETKVPPWLVNGSTAACSGPWRYQRTFDLVLCQRPVYEAAVFGAFDKAQQRSFSRSATVGLQAHGLFDHHEAPRQQAQATQPRSVSPELLLAASRGVAHPRREVPTALNRG